MASLRGYGHSVIFVRKQVNFIAWPRWVRHCSQYGPTETQLEVGLESVGV